MSALLVYLAVEQELKHRREKLAELLWPEMTIEAGRANLRHTFFQLRNALIDQTGCDTFFRSTRDWLRFTTNSPHHIDTAELSINMTSSCGHVLQESCTACREQMSRIVDLYRGEFMAGFSFPHCLEFEDWLNGKREKFHRQVLSLLERLSNYFWRNGNYHNAIRFALRQIELEPWSETGYEKAIRLYALDEQPAAALALYNSYVHEMAQEMGVPPKEGIRQLAESIRNTASVSRQSQEVQTAPGTYKVVTPERCQVTVLHCEHYTFTTEHPDDIDLAFDRVHAPLLHSMALAQSAGGHVVQLNKSGFLAYFGYPSSWEHASLHAIRAGLSIASNLVDNVDCRVGIHAGWIVTSDNPAVPDPVGLTSRIAMQLSSYGEPGKVILSEEVRRLVSSYFVFESRGKRHLNNMSYPLEIFAVNRETCIKHWFDTSSRLTPFVGRETELARLEKMWREVEKGGRHSTLIYGNAGIGKSRLVREFIEREKIPSDSIFRLSYFPEYRCLTFGVSKEISHNAVSAPAKCSTLSCDKDDRIETCSPSQCKVNTNAAIHDLLHGLMLPSKPSLLLVEDLQWLDATARETLMQYLKREYKSPMLILMTARSKHEWPALGEKVATLELPTLSNEEMATLLSFIDTTMAPELVQRIIDRADGIPLFAEELLHAAKIQSRLPIPSTLYDLLATQLNSLEDARHTAQIASTIGREFELELLQKMSSCSSIELKRSVEKLRQSGIIQEITPGRFRFRHTLMQETVYHSFRHRQLTRKTMI